MGSEEGSSQMNGILNRTHQLQQVPVYALRMQVANLMKSEGMDLKISLRIQELLQRPTKSPEKSIERLKRDQLIMLINACPEIDDATVQTLFEAYRYGANPSFHIYLFDTNFTQRAERWQIQAPFDQALYTFNPQVSKTQPPRVKKLESGTLMELDDPLLLEGDYHFQRRMDFIDAKENPTSVYETLYGFFWINTGKGYVIIHANDREILRALENAICEGIGNNIYNLIITKELKNALPFILNQSIQSCKLHDPDPASKRFRWVSIKDDDLYNKGYQDWEKRYPEISNARYRVDIGDERQRSLSVGFDTGTMGLAGRLDATQFRDWVRKRLEEIISTVQDFREKPAAYLETLRSIQELRKYTLRQQTHIIRLISKLLELKADRGIGYQKMETSPLMLAQELGQLVASQILLKCETKGCDIEDYFGCPFCGKTTLFYVIQRDGQWKLECIHHRNKKWSTPVPLAGQCENLHDFSLPEKEIEKKLEILPTRELLELVETIITKYIPKYTFDSKTESFIVRGKRFFYFEDKEMSVESQAAQVVNNYYNANVQVGTVETGGEVAAFKFRRRSPIKKGQGRGKASTKAPREKR
jgi:hypothetical protein